MGSMRYGDEYVNERPNDDEGFDYYRQAPGAFRDRDGGDAASDGYGRDWPNCRGKCFAGECKLHLGYPDCCYSSADAEYDAGYAQQQSQRAGNAKLAYKVGGGDGRGELICSKPGGAQ